MKKTIVLCADDYGQEPAISQGILALIKNRRLSATSCLVNFPYWREHSAWLLPYQQQIDIGLHFNLTEGHPLYQSVSSNFTNTFFPLSKLMRKAFFRQLNQKAIENEFHAQLDEFEKGIGTLPNFVDGHQHIHQFPIIRSAIIKVYKQRLSPNTYVRLLYKKLERRDWLKNQKKIIIYLTGTKTLKKLLDENQIPYNTSFAGIYSFAKVQSYAKQFPQFLQEIEDKGLIMCHPGLSSLETIEPLANVRHEEYQYLASHHFIQDCEKYQVHLHKRG